MILTLRVSGECSGNVTLPEAGNPGALQPDFIAGVFTNSPGTELRRGGF
jgi:hypothetical protein